MLPMLAFTSSTLAKFSSIHDPTSHCAMVLLSRVARRVGHVSRGRREIEGPGGEPLFVHAVEQHRQARPVEADAGIFRLPLHPILAVGRRAGARIAARDYHNLGMKVEASSGADAIGVSAGGLTK